jgi:hypothetical protein
VPLLRRLPVGRHRGIFFGLRHLQHSGIVLILVVVAVIALVLILRRRR